ncbi:MAG: 30S ribosomal protein S18 [Chloroflexi bacterium]|nr:30S ribosomal protein S18 [Chloroflexota bacterium]
MHNPTNRRQRPKNLTHVDLDYKRPETLRPFITEFGRIRPRRQTRLSAAKQRELVREVKRARHLALLPFAAPD